MIEKVDDHLWHIPLDDIAVQLHAEHIALFPLHRQHAEYLVGRCTAAGPEKVANAFRAADFRLQVVGRNKERTQAGIGTVGAAADFRRFGQAVNEFQHVHNRGLDRTRKAFPVVAEAPQATVGAVYHPLDGGLQQCLAGSLGVRWRRCKQ